MSLNEFPARDTAKVLGITSRRLSQLVNEQVIPGPVKRGKYDLPAVTQAYLNFRIGNDDGVKSKQLDADARYKEARAVREEMAAAKASGELAPIADMEAEVAAAFGDVSRTLETMPDVLMLEAQLTKQQATVLREAIDKQRDRLAEAVQDGARARRNAAV